MGAADFAISTTFLAKDKMTSGFKTMVKGAGQFENKLARLTKSGDKFGSCMQKALNLNTLFTGVTAFFAVAKNVKQFFDAPIKAAEIQIAAETKLTGILKNNAAIRARGANEYLKTSKELFDMASSIQQKGIIGDEVLIGGMQQLASLGFDDGVIKKMTPAIADLIVQQKGYNGTIQDAETISKGLGRALAGNAGALSRMGVVLDKNQKKQLANMTVMQRAEFLSKMLNDRVGGLNEQFGKSDRGAKIQFDNNKGDRLEEIGKRVIPIQGRIYRMLNSQMPVMSKMIDKFFNVIEYGLRTSSPVFKELKGFLFYLSKNLIPELVSYAPAIKALFENVFIPGCIFAINVIKKLCDVIGWLYNTAKGLFNFISENWMPLLAAMPAVIMGIKFALDMLTLKMALLRMEGGFLSIVMQTKLGGAFVFLKTKILGSIGALRIFGATLLANPITWYVAGALALGAAIFLLWKHWDKVTAAVGVFWGKCKEVFGKIGHFIKDNFIDILLNALGPIGLIIRGVLKLGKAVGSINSDVDPDPNPNPGIKFPNFRNGGNANNLPIAPTGPTSLTGSIGIHTTIDNNTGFNAKTTTSIMRNDNLNLTPMPAY